MKRIAITPRPDWEEKMLQQGFLFYNDDGYYNESAAYEFTSEEITLIEKATAELYRMCLEVVGHVIKNNLWDEFFIPQEYVDFIRWSWENKQPTIYGRFDLAFNNGQIKMLEFNADTPTLLLESSVIQWYWLQDYNKDLDQYNSIHDKLLKHLENCKQRLLPGKLFFTGPDNAEDFVTVKYLQDVAAQAGIETEYLFIDQVALNDGNQFAGPQGNLIKNIFKLYPWEWMFDEEFGKYLPENKDTCYWIEPPWKAILSNKMMLKYIYELFPDSPYLLPCIYLRPGETATLPQGYAKKPVFSREGENVSLVLDGTTLEETGGDYGDTGYVYQEYFELPEFGGKHPIIGSWIIGDEPAGMGIRESSGRITNVTSSFCAHYIMQG
jgi:glutathionylspermidine synthase